jgi:hypothetical protein
MSCVRRLPLHRLALLGLAVALGIAPADSHAAAVPFTGTLAVQIATLPAVSITGSGSATVTGGAHVGSIALPAGIFATTALVVPVTDPAAFPIQGVHVTAMNGTGTFSGGPLGGAMPLVGVAKVCIFGMCGGPPVNNLVVPLSVVGAGGSQTVSFLTNLTVVGAPWTTGTAQVGTLTQMGFAHGPSSSSSSTNAASGALRLVTPILISTNIGASPLVPAFGILNLHLVPEPGTLLLLACGIAVLTGAGFERRRR